MFYKALIRKISITLLVIILYRMIMLIFLPGINLDILHNVATDGVFKTMNFFGGGGIEKCSILALNIMPYITATIVTQMLSSSAGLEFFKALKKDKEMGSAKLNMWTQIFTIFIAFISAIYFAGAIFQQSQIGVSPVYISKSLFYIIVIPTLITGTMFVVFLANQISKFGIGQGTSVILFTNILSNAPNAANTIYKLLKGGQITPTILILLIIFLLIIFSFILFVEGCNRFVDIIHPGIQSTKVLRHLPLRINNADIMPVVMASSLMNLPQMLVSFLKQIGFYTETLHKYLAYCSPGGYFYYLFMATLLFVLSVSQTYIVFDPHDVARNLQESNVVILNVRPGIDTAEFLSRLLRTLNILAGLYLIIVCVLSEYISYLFNQAVGVEFINFGGTSILIAVSVSQLIFKGFKSYNYQKLVDPLIHK